MRAHLMGVLAALRAVLHRPSRLDLTETWWSCRGATRRRHCPSGRRVALAAGAIEPPHPTPMPRALGMRPGAPLGPLACWARLAPQWQCPARTAEPRLCWARQLPSGMHVLIDEPIPIVNFIRVEWRVGHHGQWVCEHVRCRACWRDPRVVSFGATICVCCTC